MLQTHLYLTQTYLQTENIQKIIAEAFLQHETFLVSSTSNLISEETWQHYINTNQVILWSSSKTETDSQKEQFRRFIQTEVYMRYRQPTILFLGDLTEYSDTLQEGMLKLLEEPPENLFIVLLAQSLSILKPTIVSRSQIHTLPLSLILANLDQTLLEKTKKLPAPKDVVNNLLTNQKVEVEKVSDYERNELDFWLWQVQTNLSFVYQQQTDANTTQKVAEVLSKVLHARKLNSDNLQKKFALGWLNT
jgi:DNA polymerase III, delta subunit